MQCVNFRLVFEETDYNDSDGFEDGFTLEVKDANAIGAEGVSAMINMLDRAQVCFSIVSFVYSGYFA